MKREDLIRVNTRLKEENSQLKIERKFKNHSQIALTVGNLGMQLFKWTGICVCFYFIYMSIAALAGQTTLANIGIQVLANITVTEALAWVLAGTGSLWAIKERRLRKKAVHHLTPRSKQLELMIDPNRSTSKLTGLGETNPMDAD